ncbi:MAG: hypothetical protein ACRCTL_01705 [Pseudomonas sp.]
MIDRASTLRAIRNALDQLGRYVAVHLLGTGNPADTLQIGVVTRNNQCARQIRDNYIELQNWTKEQLNHGTD